jgi:hypothetical protein
MFGVLFVGASFPIPAASLQQVDATHWVSLASPPPLPMASAPRPCSHAPPPDAPPRPPRAAPSARPPPGARRLHRGGTGLLAAEGGLPLPDRPHRRRHRGGAVRQGRRERVAVPRLCPQRAALRSHAAAVAGARGRGALRAGPGRGAAGGKPAAAAAAAGGRGNPFLTPRLPASMLLALPPSPFPHPLLKPTTAACTWPPQIGIEPLAELASKEGSRLGEKMDYARRVGLDLVKFMQSYPTQMVNGGEARGRLAAQGGAMPGGCVLPACGGGGGSRRPRGRARSDSPETRLGSRRGGARQHVGCAGPLVVARTPPSSDTHPAPRIPHPARRRSHAGAGKCAQPVACQI